MLREINAQLLIQAQMQKQEQPLSMIIAPVGVGSLTQAILCYYKSPNNTSTPPAVVTVEPDTAATLHKSLKAGTSLSITTSPTIMAGLECGTLSSIAWPLLQPGVDISTTISDWECHHAIEYLKKHDVGAGPCGGAALGGLRRLAADLASKGVLNRDSVVVCICTEGARSYTFPTPVGGGELSLVGALMVLHMTPSVTPDWSMEKVPVFAALNYIAQWLEYRNIDISWVDYGSPHASLVAKVKSAPGVGGTGARKSLLLISHLPSKTKSDPNDVYIGLGAVVLALAQLQQSASTAGLDITLAISPSVAGLKSVLDHLGNPDAALLVDTVQYDLVTIQSGLHIAFARKVKESVGTMLGREVPLMNIVPGEGTVLGLLKERNIPLCMVGILRGNLVDNRGGNEEESEYMVARSLFQVGKALCSW